MNKSFSVVEIGSTNTKGYIYRNNILEEIPFINIEFKKNYKENKNKILESDKCKLFKYIHKISQDINMIYIFGTSIFRDLNEEDKESFIKEFKQNTGFDFKIVSSEDETKYTVYGAINNVDYNGDIAIMIGGGGSTEIAICNNGNIIEMANSKFGVVDTFDKFGDLNNQYATSDREEVVDFIKMNLNKPTLKANILILAGSNQILSYVSAKYPLVKNTLFNSTLHPYMISAEDRAKYDLEYYYNINLDDMRKITPENPNWWNGSRSMSSFSKSVSDIVEAKYIIPTNINMVYGIIEKILKEEL